MGGGGGGVARGQNLEHLVKVVFLPYPTLPYPTLTLTLTYPYLPYPTLTYPTPPHPTQPSQSQSSYAVMRQLLLAHLSQRLIGELIGYPWSSVCCRHRPSTISNVFSSETARPIKAKFYVEPPWEGGTKFV